MTRTDNGGVRLRWLTQAEKWLLGVFVAAVLLAIVATVAGAEWFYAGFLYGFIVAVLLLTAWLRTNGR